jgi:hypothetical protein
MRGAAAALAITLLVSAPAHPVGWLQAQQTHVLIVSGLGGDPQYGEQFVDWGLTMVEAAEAAGVPSDQVVFLAEDPDAAPGRIDGRSTREEVEEQIRLLGESAAPEDRVLVLLIGHGGGSGAESRVSLPGPSLRASEYSLLLEQLAPRTVALVNLASASGDFIPEIVGEGRIVITATRSSRQRNAALFGGYFVEAFAGGGADVDRDGRISLLEAFEYARLETDRYYEDRGLLSSETALLEDRVNGPGADEPLGEDGVGQLAARFFLESAVPTEIAGTGETADRLRQLYAEQATLEDDIARLTQRQATMDPTEYQAALETLLVRLAEVGSEIRDLEASP